VARDDDVLALCDLILAGGAHELTDQYTLVLYPGDDPADPAAAARPPARPTILSVPNPRRRVSRP